MTDSLFLSVYNTKSTCREYTLCHSLQVVCRFLGYETALEALSNGYFGAGDDSQPIWLDNVQCFGSENSITECLTPPFGENRCRHTQDAGVRCYGEFELLCNLWKIHSFVAQLQRNRLYSTTLYSTLR